MHMSKHRSHLSSTEHPSLPAKIYQLDQLDLNCVDLTQTLSDYTRTVVQNIFKGLTKLFKTALDASKIELS